MQNPESAILVEQAGVDTVREYALIVSRNKWLIAAAIAGSLMLAWIYLLIAPKYYQSQSLIVQEGRKGIDDVINSGERADQHFEKRLFLIGKQIASQEFLEPIIKELGKQSEGSDEQGELASWREFAGMTKVERALMTQPEAKVHRIWLMALWSPFYIRIPILPGG
ncbi:MAG: hypothetical protein HC938_11070 [Nitrospira sp.]|nr:hypothetical protein [Nitrospira sp.]